MKRGTKVEQFGAQLSAARGLIWNIENLKKRGSPVYFLTVDAAEFYKSKENIE